MIAKELIEKLEKNPDLEIGNVVINFHFFSGDKNKALSDFAKMFGNFTQNETLGSKYFEHLEKGIEVTFWTGDRCKIVGKTVKKVKVPILKTVGYEEKEEESLVTDCELSKGLVKSEDVIFLLK